MDVFSTQPWEDYLQEMSHHGTYGDQISLQAVTDMLGVEILLSSTLGSEGQVWIFPRSHCAVLYVDIFLKEKEYIMLR